MKRYLILCLYYVTVEDNDSLDWGNLLLRKRRSGEQRLAKSSLDRIFTTGLPPGDANRNYSS